MSRLSITSDRLADVHRAAFRIERRVRREHHLIDAEELQSALGRCAAAEDGRVGPEHLEIVVRPLLHRREQRGVVLVGRARPELVEAVADAPFEVRESSRRGGARRSLMPRQPIEQPREHQPLHRRARLVRPAERPPDLVFRFRLAGIVGEAGAARRVQQDRAVQAGRPSRTAAKNRSSSSGRPLTFEKSWTPSAPSAFTARSSSRDALVGMIERQRRDESRKPVRMRARRFRHRVVRQPSPDRS